MDDLGFKVREKLLRHQLTVKWLALQLNKCGMDVTYQNLCTALTGGRRGAVACNWLYKSMEILAAYEAALATWQKEGV